MRMSATYDPADNKLRLSAAQRLDADTYARVKAAGFSWAPKQGIFVAPAWSPQREDLLLELTARCQECGGDDALPEPGDEGIPICSECGGNFAGEIGDEDTTLVDRAEQRAERFENYSEKREADAERAHAAVSRIADNIPLGQPILVGHHSERHARKDAARIENGMRRAVKMWETSQYWEARAAGALHHAKYKERPDVRFRRIKGIEADKRKAEKATADALQFIALWQADDLKWYQARAIANHDHVHECFPLADYPRTAICMECDFPMGERETCGRVRVLVHRETKERTEVACTGQSKSASTYEGSMGLWSALAGIITAGQARDIAIAAHTAGNAWRARWIAHYNNRLTYERAMLGESGGVAGTRFDFQPGGRVLVGTEWQTIIRVNKSAGAVNSLTTNGRYVSKVGIEEVNDYRAPDASETAAVKKATKLPPLCNYPGEGFRHMTKADYERRHHFISEASAERTHGAPYDPKYVPHRLRVHLKGGGGLDCHNYVGVYLTDEKLKFPPAADEAAAAALVDVDGPAVPDIPPPEHDLPALIAQTEHRAAAQQARETALRSTFADMKELLRSGNLPRVEVVHAPGFYPTPPELAARMVDLADVGPGMRVLEPSAGAGAIADLLRDAGADVVCCELHYKLADALAAKGHQVVAGDFIERFSVSDPQGGAFNAETEGIEGEDVAGDVAPKMRQFDRVVMNPPFERGTDITHIRHALKLLKPGGRLVALCANGPRQREALQPLAEDSGGWWEDLPAGSFKSAGTGVNVALLVIEVPPAAKELPAPEAASCEQCEDVPPATSGPPQLALFS